MSSINTNIAAMTALQSLNSTNNELLTTQNRISTGLKVANASDNAAYWSIATTMRSDRQSLSTVSDALGLGSATSDIASKGLDSAITVAGQLKDKLLAARTPGVDRSKIQSEIKELQSSLQEIVSGASFNGQNWLTGDSSDTDAMTRTLVASFSRDSAGAISIGTISVDLTKSLLVDTNSDPTAKAGALDTQKTTTNGGVDYTVLDLDISGLTDSANDLGDLEEMLTTVDGAITTMTDAASSLGAVKTRMDIQKDFSASLMDAIDKGVSQLVDADMNEESTRLQALQVRQQLGIQALSIANQSAQSILSLFR
jgi:flagellin